MALECGASSCAAVPALPPDALRRVFHFLDWQSLCACSCCSTSWRQLAAEDQQWQQHVSRELYRPNLLAYSAAQLPAGFRQDDEAKHSTIAAAQAAAGALLQSSTGAVVSSSSQPKQHAAGLLKPLFAAGVLHAAGPHQTLLARFNAAVSQIIGWRVVFTASSSSHSSSTSAGPQANPQPAPRQPHATNSARSSRQVEPQCGQPAALTLQALQSGGWACGCVVMQRQEQSCWVRFNLPPELKADADVAQAVAAKHVDAVLQGLGPSGWFDVATAEGFELSDDDMVILMQSHRSGFYAWDQGGEPSGGVDRFDQLHPLPWDLRPGQQQQPQQQQHQKEGGGLQQPAQPIQQQQQPPPQQPAAHPQQQQQQQPQQAEGEHEEPAPQLRMLVYVHFEQLLQVLPWALPHTLHLGPRPVLQSPEALAQHLLGGPCALWLQLDVCQLHGGFKVGTCSVPLRLRRWTKTRAEFACIEEQLLVALYTPDSSINSTQGLAGAAGAPKGQAAAAGAAGSSSGTARGPPAAAAAAAAGAGVLEQGACSQVFLAADILRGTAPCRRDGSVMRSAADALEELMTQDEVMVDFALFDARGHLLLGRAGVEVWSKEKTEEGFLVVPNTQQQQQQQEQQEQEEECPATPDSCSSSCSIADLAAAIGPLHSAHPLTPQQQEEALRFFHSFLDIEREMELYLSVEEAERQRLLEQGRVARVFSHQILRLHFLVDGQPESAFRATSLTVDAQQPPQDFERFRPARGTVSLSVLWPSLRSMFGLQPCWASADTLEAWLDSEWK